LTGRRPYPQGVRFAVLAARAASAPPPLRTLQPTLPLALTTLIHGMLDTDPRCRPANAACALSQLQEALECAV
jgi:hypothetical protein